jgi:hypothetical protein
MVVLMRRNTFRIYLDGLFGFDGKRKWTTYREYNEEVWEPWLKEAYHRNPLPFLDGPEANYAHALDPHTQSTAAFRAQIALTGLSKPDWLLYIEDGSVCVERWTSMSRREREDILLYLWEVEQAGAEQGHGTVNRMWAPEFTLDNLAGDGGREMIRLARSIRPPEGFDAASSPVPHFTNDAYDRLWSIGKYEPSIPFSRAKRAFIETGIAARTWLQRVVRLHPFPL